MLRTLLCGIEDLKIEEVAEPQPGPGEVKVRVAHNGLCGSDVRFYFDDGPRTVGPQPLGHEFSGTITAVGRDVDPSRISESVAVCPYRPCRQCPSCQLGAVNVCDSIREYSGIVGCGGPQGGLSQYVVVPSEQAVALPKEMSLLQGALVEPMSVAFNGVLRSGIQPGETAVILGGGPIGVGVAIALGHIGVDSVVASEPVSPRRAILSSLGVETVDPTNSELAEIVKRMTNGRGASAVFVCAAAPPLLRAGVQMLRARGRAVLIAACSEDVPMNPSDLLRMEREIVASCGFTPETYVRVVGLVASGGYPILPWIHRIPLDAVVEDGLKPLRRGERMKVIVDITS